MVGTGQYLTVYKRWLYYVGDNKTLTDGFLLCLLYERGLYFCSNSDGRTTQGRP